METKKYVLGFVTAMIAGAMVTMTACGDARQRAEDRLAFEQQYDFESYSHERTSTAHAFYATVYPKCEEGEQCYIILNDGSRVQEHRIQCATNANSEWEWNGYALRGEWPVRDFKNFYKRACSAIAEAE